ncbi:MAG: pectin methylesterase [Odoribacteraceae bacterium]|jgi:pectinesterase|nr:pectin methylesterase [Odoribacteraceae bacterium]
MKTIANLSFALALLTLCFGNASGREIVVSPDGDGDHATLAAAFQALPDDPTTWTIIHLRPGIYKEKLVLDVHKNKVKIIGEDPLTTVITWGDHTGKVVNGDTIHTYTSYTLSVRADDVTFANITIENSAGAVGQAVACETRGDRLCFINCRLVGNQDTFFTRGTVSRVYLKNCYIEGTTDYIFGPSVALFDSCHLHSKKNSFITAASTTERNTYGYVFRDCRVTVAPGVTRLYLGRPWRSFARTVFIRCHLPAEIAPAGWDNWRAPEKEKTVYYAEYRSTGAGANPTARVPWSHQLTDNEADAYTPRNIFGKNTGGEPFAADWNIEINN